MPCVNHPAVSSGLDSCTRCAKTFCIDCLTGRQSGWFCAACDTEAGGKPAPAKSPEAPVQMQLSAEPEAAKAGIPGISACRNHSEVTGGLALCTRCGKSFCGDCLVELKGSRYCAGCKSDAVKDIQSGVDGSGLQLASIGQRFVALFIDGFAVNIIIIPLFVILGVVISVVQPDQDSFVLPLLVFAFYGVIFVAIFCYHGFMLQWKGQTLGKMAMKIKVVTPEGGPISAGQAWIRVLVWFLLHGCLIDYIPALFNKEKMAIHDMAARTRVVKLN